MAVREGLLALLQEGPAHGYQLKTAFEATTGGAWHLNVGQVYTTLDRLARDGLVDVDDSGEQKRYSITAAGREELGAWWQTAPADEPPPRDELLLKVLFALESGPDRALEVITRHRSALTTRLQAHRRTARAAEAAPAAGDPDAALAAALVADAVATRAEADLRWLDLCEARILRARRRTTDQKEGSRG